MNNFNLVNLSSLMALTEGIAEIQVGLIDGPVEIAHPSFLTCNVRAINHNNHFGVCQQSSSFACQHGTYVAGILSARRNSSTPGICPGSTLLIRAIFADKQLASDDLPSATANELAAAIKECIIAGVRIINVSAAIATPSLKSEYVLEDAIDLAAQQGVLVICAAGNQGQLGSTAMTRHPWVIPVIAANAHGRPMNLSNLGNSIGKRGLAAPGEKIVSLSAGGKTLVSGGTSAAAPFVTGTIALLWSLFPQASASQIKLAISQAIGARRNSVAPPLLNAYVAYKTLSNVMSRKLYA